MFVKQHTGGPTHFSEPSGNASLHSLPRINVLLSPKMSSPCCSSFSNRFCCLLADSVIASVIT